MSIRVVNHAGEGKEECYSLDIYASKQMEMLACYISRLMRQILIERQCYLSTREAKKECHSLEMYASKQIKMS